MRERTCAVFESTGFDTGEVGPDSRRPESFGADVVKWFVQELRLRQISVDEAGAEQEDHGWYTTFVFEDKRHDLIVSHIPGTEVPRWLVCVERSVGLIGTLLGRRQRSVTRGVPALIDEVLSKSVRVRKIGWMSFEEVRRGLLHEAEWAEHP